jgi:signal transduction histidine kinase
MNVSVLIVFFSFLILGIILTLTITNYWSNEKRQVMDRRADTVVSFIRRHSAIDPSLGMGVNKKFYISQLDTVQELLRLYVDDVGIDVIVTDIDANPVMIVNSNSSDSMDIDKVMNSQISSDIVDKTIQDSEYFSKGTLDGIYKTDKYISARPIYYNSQSNVMGIVMVISDTKDIASFTDMVMRIFILSAIATLSISVLAIGLFSYNFVKPIKQVAKATRQFGRGDFSVRVNIASDDEIGELAKSFNNMAESLSASENVRRSFVANVSHELKTPMTTIAGFIDGILDGTIPKEKQNYYLSIVSEEIKRLARLVRSMLDLSRLDSGEMKLNYQNFDLLSMLVTIIITFEQEIETKNIEIKGLDSISSKMVYGDRDLLYQVVYNLIENAVKFTNENGYIELNITDNSEQVDFSVKNSGQGISKSEIGLIFDRFYKTDKSRSKDKKGLGLGLYLVRSIIRMHGGDITAKSEYGEYCEFDFYIPKKQEKK